MTLKLLIFAKLFFSILLAEKINLNNASTLELESLGFTKIEIDHILNYRIQVGYFETVYDLVNVDIEPNKIHSIRKKISTEIPSLSTFEKDIKKASYKLGQWIANEGNSEGLSEIWLDKFFEPQNVNEMSYDDLMALPNLSPVDAVAVLKQKKRGYINGTWELKNSPGISRWGYKNLVDFIRFDDVKDENDSSIHVRLNSLVRSVPITSNPDEDGTIDAFNGSSIPQQFHKLSINKGQHYKAGFSYHRYLGQPNDIYTAKGFLQIEKQNVFGIKVDRFIIGNFTASYGQGVVFESSDNFSPRRTGLGFSKRTEGINGDMTRSCQYVMRGTALQLSTDFLRASMFASLHPRDAIINDPNYSFSSSPVDADSVYIKDSFTSLIVMQPRLPYGANNDTSLVHHSLVGSINELTWGGNIRFSPVLGTHLGFTFFESLYDKYHYPRVIETITGGNGDTDPEFDFANDYDDYSGDAFYLKYITNSTDPEIAAMDTSIADSPIWNKAKSFVRVSGINFNSVFSNISIQAEYGVMMKDNPNTKNPDALVLSTFAQFSNFNLVALYRNYDLEYDNPYQRSYSNYQRFKTSIFEDTYWLEDPIYAFLYTGNPQPQAEEGFFVSSRYQFHRSMVGTLNWDTWNRKADNSKYYRTVAAIDWRPVFNFRIKLRQKWQARGTFDIQHPSPFYSRETRLQARLRMSRYNQFEILYSNGYTTFSPRPRLTDSAIGGEMMVGDVGSPDESIGISFNHNADENFSIKGGLLYVNGFLWYFEDTDFRIFNSENGAVHKWASVDLKPTSLFRIMLKVSHTMHATSTRIVDAQSPNGSWINNPQVTNEDLDFRIQVNYAL